MISTYVHFTRLNTRVVITNQVDSLEISGWLVYEIDPLLHSNSLVIVIAEPDLESAQKTANLRIEMAGWLADAVKAEPEDRL